MAPYETRRRVDQLFKAPHIWSEADVEDLTSYEDNLTYYRNNSYSYIPIPASYKYYNVEREEMSRIDAEQWITVDCPLMKVIELLTRQDFLLVDGAATGFYEKDGQIIELADVRKNEEEWVAYIAEHGEPESAHEHRYHIITWTDLKKKEAKEAIYPLVSGVSIGLADKIENHFPDSEEVPFNQIKDETLGRWFYDRRQGKELHIAEYLDLTEMKQVIKSDEELIERCGFTSNTELKNQLYHIADLRNKIMHANRTLIGSQEEVEELANRLKSINRIVNRLE